VAIRVQKAHPSALFASKRRITAVFLRSCETDDLQQELGEEGAEKRFQCSLNGTKAAPPGHGKPEFDEVAARKR